MKMRTKIVKWAMKLLFRVFGVFVNIKLWRKFVNVKARF